MVMHLDRHKKCVISSENLSGIGYFRKQFKTVRYIPDSLQESVDLTEFAMSFVNFSKELVSFSIPLMVPSSSDELT